MAAKNTVKTTTGKEMPLSPTNTNQPVLERDELLGSLTTQQQQRTSARVIKKLRLDDAAADRDKKELSENEKLKEEEKDITKLTVKHRMPKVWSADEKNLFFEALNEYGKDFDAITAYICTKLKKKGVTDIANLKTKSQVAHFYYRTWHKLSKHVSFDENVKKLAQELYALINYGELRRKLSSVNEKTCARLGEMVTTGSLVVRLKGKNVRVRTPMCRALRRLNQITEVGCWWWGRGGRVSVSVSPRDRGGWWRVAVTSHNPLSLLPAPPRTSLHHLIRVLQDRWHTHTQDENKDASTSLKSSKQMSKQNYLGIEPDRLISEEQTNGKRFVLHVGPRPDATIHLPTLTASEHMSTQKICFSSYLERVYRDKELQPKLRTPKRTRKDSATDKECESKKFKGDDPLTDDKLVMIDETAIDGIELMASYKYNIHQHEDDDKNFTEDEREPKSDQPETENDPNAPETQTETDSECKESEKETADASEREVSFSEMEDKSETDNDSDCKDKSSLKVKFRIRSKKRGTPVYALVDGTHDMTGKQSEEKIQIPEDNIQIKDLTDTKINVEDQNDTEKSKEVKVQNETETTNVDASKTNVDAGKTNVDAGKSNLDVGRMNVDVGKTHVDVGKTQVDAGKTNIDGGKINVDVGKTNVDAGKTNVDAGKTHVIPGKCQDETGKVLESHVKADELKIPDDHLKEEIRNQNEQEKSEVDVDFAIRQIRKGWSMYDAGNLTVGDLYLMFGSRSKLHLEYWWAEPTAPIARSNKHKTEDKTACRLRTCADKKDKLEHTPEKYSGVCGDKRDAVYSDTELLSPRRADRHTDVRADGQDSNDGLSGDERKYEPLASPEHKSSIGSGVLELTSKLVNRPETTSNTSQVSLMSGRLKRLLSLMGNQFCSITSTQSAGGHSCECGHICPLKKKKNEPRLTSIKDKLSPVFLHPRPIAPKPGTEEPEARENPSWSGLPRGNRRGRRPGEGRVVVQRLLPLLPKLTHNDLIPVELLPPKPGLPRLLPKPEISDVTSGAVTSSKPNIYVLSEQHGQFYYHEGDLKIPINQIIGPDQTTEEDDKSNISIVETTETKITPNTEGKSTIIEQTATGVKEANLPKKEESADITSLLRQEWCLSPSMSRLDEGAWLEGGQDFSLSSFLHQLERPNTPQMDSQLQSLIGESSVDYVAKFADLAAEVADNNEHRHGKKHE